MRWPHGFRFAPEGLPSSTTSGYSLNGIIRPLPGRWDVREVVDSGHHADTGLASGSNGIKMNLNELEVRHFTWRKMVPYNVLGTGKNTTISDR